MSKKYTEDEKNIIRNKSTRHFNDMSFGNRGEAIPSSIMTQVNELEKQKMTYKKLISDLNIRIESLYNSAEESLKEIEK